MKKTSLVFRIILLLMPLLAAGQHEPIRHRLPVSFSKSPLGDTLDAEHYYIHITGIDFTAKELYAWTEAEIRSKVDNLSVIRLELLNLTADSVFVNGSQIAGFTHTGYMLNIPLPAPMQSGESSTVRVFYHGIPFHEDWGGFHWSGEYCFNLGVGFVSDPHNLGKAWFPCIDDFQDRALYDVSVTVEDGIMAVCGGTLVETINNGNGTNTWHWSIQHPIPTYLASVAVGEYVGVYDTYAGINGDIPIEIYVRPMDSSKVAGSFLHLHEIMDIYEDKWGPYPFERIGYVGTAIGAMEHATNVAYPHFCIDNSLTYESLYAHELSHMWFGDNATCASAGEMWLNEGWAVFCETIVKEFLYGKDVAMELIKETHADVLTVCHTPSGDGSYFPLNQIPTDVTYGVSAYDKGMTVVHTLRGYLGDQVFFDAMKAYQQHFALHHVSSEDFRDFLTMQTGTDMSGFFDNWVLHAGTPHFSVDSFQVIPSGKGSTVNIFMRQRRKGPAFTGVNNRVEVTLMDDNWNQETVLVSFSGDYGAQSFQVPIIPTVALCDLNEVLCDAVTHHAEVIKTASEINFPETHFKMEVESISDSAFIRVEHNWVPSDSLKTPVPGVRLSPYRYWKIDGVLPDDFQATGRFWYKSSGYLDDSLLTNPEDSIIILYRSGTADDWHFIPFEIIGSFQIGNIFVHDLQLGEYTLAVCDSTFVDGIIPRSSGIIPVKVFPNPSRGSFQLEFSTREPLILEFLDLTGRVIDTLSVKPGTEKTVWEAKHYIPGTYFMKVSTPGRKTLGVQKLVLTD
ncbi:MAG: T9SS type A sorting domain-containing protein [Bacteroidales bacterium]|nr:T9SS type A sorting domain-containing protein [Bacteroidales bacterium]